MEGRPMNAARRTDPVDSGNGRWKEYVWRLAIGIVLLMLTTVVGFGIAAKNDIADLQRGIAVQAEQLKTKETDIADIKGSLREMQRTLSDIRAELAAINASRKSGS
jgi:hypothetical protein